MLIDVGKADTHDMADISALDAHFAQKRADEHAAAMAAEAAKIDVARSAARATVIKRAGVATLLGGVGLGAALFGASFLVTPQVHFTDIEVPRVTMRDVTVDHVIPHDVPVDHVVPHEKVIEIPRVVEKTVTKKEDDFIHRPDYEAATNKGRIIKSKTGSESSSTTTPVSSRWIQPGLMTPTALCRISGFARQFRTPITFFVTP